MQICSQISFQQQLYLLIASRPIRVAFEERLLQFVEVVIERAFEVLALALSQLVWSNYVTSVLIENF